MVKDLFIVLSDVPKRAVKKQGLNVTPRAWLMVLKNNAYYLSRLEQDQNICARLAGEKEHLSQAVSNTEYIPANLALLSWTVCRTLNCMSPNTAKVDEWTLLIASFQ